MKKITLSLDDKSIGNAIKELARYKKWVADKTQVLIERLALIGGQEASIRFASAIYDGQNDVVVNVEPIANGWMITASGEAVCFLEFGAGVYHNPSEPHPNRPAGISQIGEYGKGMGKRQAWGYYDESGSLVITHGNPAVLGMWYATQEMEREVLRIAREVFA